MLDTCSQGTFTTINLMEQLNISGIQTSINMKTLIGHQKESSYIVEHSVLPPPLFLQGGLENFEAFFKSVGLVVFYFLGGGPEPEGGIVFSRGGGRLSIFN